MDERTSALSAARDLDQAFATLEKVDCIREGHGEDLLKPYRRGVATCQPDDSRWWSMLLKQKREVMILRHDHRVSGPGSEEDLSVRGVS